MSNRRLESKVALITGGGTGIGAAIARRFVNAGASVVVCGRRVEPLQRIADEIDCLPLAGDVSSLDDCTNLVAETKKQLGGLDIVVANAGIYFEGSVIEQDMDEWQRTLDINVSGVMNIARAAIPEMLGRPGANILNISSMAALFSGPGMASYSTAKAALIGLTRAMAVDYGPQGIRVNCLCPGWIKTPMSTQEMHDLSALKNISVEQAFFEATRYLPLQRMADADEIAACAEFLTSEDASFVTGTTLVADGGGSAKDIGTLAFE